MSRSVACHLSRQILASLLNSRMISSSSSAALGNSTRLSGLSSSALPRGFLRNAQLHTSARCTALQSLASGSNGGSSGGGSNNRGGGNHGDSGGDSGDHFRRLPWMTSLAAAAQLAVLTGSASAAKAGPPKKEELKKEELTVDNVTDMLWDLAGPVLTNLGFSGCIGAAAGMAFKKVGQFMAVTIGLLFALVQGLAYSGYITVNWTKVNDTVNATLDLNQDGKVDQDDFKHFVGQGLGALAQGVPSVGGFLAGFYFGLRM